MHQNEALHKARKAAAMGRIRRHDTLLEQQRRAQAPFYCNPDVYGPGVRHQYLANASIEVERPEFWQMHNREYQRGPVRYIVCSVCGHVEPVRVEDVTYWLGLNNSPTEVVA